MRSIDSQLPLAVPLRRASVTAFWVLAAPVLSLASGVAAVAVGARAPWVVAAAIGVAVVVPGVVWPPWYERGVWLWNGTVRRMAWALGRYTLGVTYFTLFAPLRLSGSRIASTPGGSRWHALDAASPLTAPAVGTWYQQLLVTAGASQGRWVIVLVPILLLLRRLEEPGQDLVAPGSTYTLY